MNGFDQHQLNQADSGGHNHNSFEELPKSQPLQLHNMKYQVPTIESSDTDLKSTENRYNKPQPQTMPETHTHSDTALNIAENPYENSEILKMPIQNFFKNRNNSNA